MSHHLGVNSVTLPGGLEYGHGTPLEQVYIVLVHCKNMWVILTHEMVTSVGPCVRFLAMLL